MPRANSPTSLTGVFDSVRADYSAAKQNRFRKRRVGVGSVGHSGDYHLRSEADLIRMMEYARDMDRNDVIIGPAVTQAVTNTLGDGLRPDAKTPDTKLNDDLEAAHIDWANDPDRCDAAGEHDFHTLSALAFRQRLVDGDTIGLPLTTAAIELVEAHRLRTPTNTKLNVVHGVLLDRHRKRQQYWIAKADIDLHHRIKRVGDMRKIDTRDAQGNRQVLHLYDPERVSSTRSASAIGRIFDTAGMFDDINFAKLVQQQVVSSFAVFRKRAVEFDGPPDPPQRGPIESSTHADGASRSLEGIGPGMEITGAPGEELTGFSPNVPNAEFFDHVRLMLQLIGRNLGLPLVMMMMDGSETNFSGWRGAVDEARRGFKRNQSLMITQWYRPIWKWRLRQLAAGDPVMARAMARHGPAFFAHEWKRPAWPYIEPLKDRAAELLSVRNGQTSQRRAQAERGAEWSQVAREMVEDNALAIRLAKQQAADLNKEFPDDPPVHWREVLALPTSEGVLINIDGNTGEATATTSQPEKN